MNIKLTKRLIIYIVILFSLVTCKTAKADCQGCCSHHGGVVCRNGITQCSDGTSLSETCRNKGCDVCDDGEYFTTTAEYRHNGDNTITDTSTYLVWREDATPIFYQTIEDANKFVESLNKGTYSTWRLPTTTEIEHIKDYIETKYDLCRGEGLFWAIPNAISGVCSMAGPGFSVRPYSSLESGAAVWAVRNNTAPVANAGEDQPVQADQNQPVTTSPIDNVKDKMGCFIGFITQRPERVR